MPDDDVVASPPDLPPPPAATPAEAATAPPPPGSAASPAEPAATPAADAGELVEVAACTDEDEARAIGATLVEHGIGAELRRVDHVDAESGVAVTAWQVLALGLDQRRAQEVLGIVEAAPVPMGDDEHPAVLEKGPTPWKSVLLIWLAALIIIPILAFLFTIAVLGH